MAAEAQRQRFSFWGGVSLLGVGVIVYICVSEGQLLILYWLATLGLIGLMWAVLFDLGAKGGSGPPDKAVIEPTQGTVPATATAAATARVSSPSPAPSPRRRKKRKRRR